MENGPSKETDVNLPDGVVYCVNCGTVFVHDIKRECPSCYNDERIAGLEEGDD